MTYPTPGGTPDPYQPQQPYGQPYDPTTPYTPPPDPAYPPTASQPQAIGAPRPLLPPAT